MPEAEAMPSACREGVWNAKRLIERGRALRAGGRTDQAAEAFEEALGSSPPESEPYWRNAALNELEITRGTVVLRSKPRSLSMVLSNRCNIECVMCSVWNDPWEMPEASLREIEELFPTLSRLMWQGGEVFMSPRFEPLFDRAASHPHLQQHITTNGLLMSRKWAKKLVRSNSWLIFSIDGATKRTYERIRKKGRFERLLEGIMLLNEARGELAAESGGRLSFETTMNSTIMRSNYREIGQLVEFAHAQGFDTLQINPVDTTGPEDIFRTPDADALSHIEKALPRMRERARELGLALHVWLPPMGRTRFIREADPSAQESGGMGRGAPRGGRASVAPNELSCRWPWQDLWIDKGGKVRPHCFCGKDIGNVGESGIMDLWNNEIMREYRRRLHANMAAGWCSNRCVEGAIPKAALGLKD